MFPPFKHVGSYLLWCIFDPVVHGMDICTFVMNLQYLGALNNVGGYIYKRWH